jgi:cobalt/nickel transport system permease protein
VALIVTGAIAAPGAWIVYVILLTVTLSTAVLSELGIGYVLRRAFLVLPFVLAALPVLFTQPGPALLGLGPFSLTVTGLERFLGIVLKSWISLQAAIVLVATTSMPDLLVALRALHLPRLLVTMIALMWRYLFLMVEEVQRLLRARLARSRVGEDGRRSGASVIWRAQVTGGMAGSLLVRSFERSDRVYAAMLARGYDGEIRLLPGPRPAAWNGWVLGMGLLFFMLVTLLGVIYA